MEIGAALEPSNAPNSHRSGPSDAEGVAEQHDLIRTNEHPMDPDPETRGMIKLDRPCEQLERRVDVLEERPAERGLIPNVRATSCVAAQQDAAPSQTIRPI